MACRCYVSLGLAALAAATAFAQVSPPLTCLAQAAVTPSIRAEGAAELVGDVVISCNGGRPAAAGESLRLHNFLAFTGPSINITSRLLAVGGTGSFSEALLFIDEPKPEDQTLCGSPAFSYSVPADSGQTVISGNCGGLTGAGSGVGTYDPNVSANRGNVFQARQLSSNSLVWQGVPFDPPGSMAVRIFRLTNIRVNASQLGVPSGSRAAVQTFVTTSTAGFQFGLPITNPTPTVGIAQISLGVPIVDRAICHQCEPANADFADDPSKALVGKGGKSCDGVAFVLRLSETAFPSAFRRRNEARAIGLTPSEPIRQDLLGAGYQTESGFMKTESNGDRWPLIAANNSRVAGVEAGTLGLADHGTRLMARFSNIQNGAQIWVEAVAPLVQPRSSSTGFAALTVTDPNGAGPFQPATIGSIQLNGIAQVPIAGGAGAAVWEVIETDTTEFETMEARVVIAYIANSTANLPGLGSSTVNASYGPVSATPTASATAPTPRFFDSKLSYTILTINACRTNILFPFVSNQGGFDTGLAIVNTSKDPFGTNLHEGACTINFYGTVGNAKVCLSSASPSISGGEHFAWSLSSGGAVQATPGFQGYVIAQCQFRYGHGFAFLTDFSAQRLAMGYLALVMDESLGTRTGIVAEAPGH